jgi:hypothetical protein
MSARTSILAALLSLHAGASWAETRHADAEKLIKKGIALRSQRKDKEALEAFREANKLEASPRAVAQMALAEEALEDWVGAERDLEQAIASRSDAWIKSKIGPLEESLRVVREHLGTLQLEGTAGAMVEVNGRALGKLPLESPLRVRAGSVTVLATLEGFVALERITSVPAQGEARVSLELQAKRDDAQKAPPAPPPPQASPSPSGPVTPEAAVARASTEKEGSSTLAWIAAGGAALGTAAGVVSLIIRAKNVAKYNDDSICAPGNGLTRIQNCPGARSAAYEAQTAAIISFAAGAALAITSAVLFVTASPEDAGQVPPSTARAACGIGLGQVACAIDF